MALYCVGSRVGRLGCGCLFFGLAAQPIGVGHILICRAACGRCPGVAVNNIGFRRIGIGYRYIPHGTGCLLHGQGGDGFSFTVKRISRSIVDCRCGDLDFEGAAFRYCQPMIFIQRSGAGHALSCQKLICHGNLVLIGCQAGIQGKESGYIDRILRVISDFVALRLHYRMYDLVRTLRNRNLHRRAGEIGFVFAVYLLRDQVGMIIHATLFVLLSLPEP